MKSLLEFIWLTIYWFADLKPPNDVVKSWDCIPEGEVQHARVVFNAKKTARVTVSKSGKDGHTYQFDCPMLQRLQGHSFVIVGEKTEWQIEEWNKRKVIVLSVMRIKGVTTEQISVMWHDPPHERREPAQKKRRNTKS